MEKERITIASKEDFEVSYYCGSGPGGTNRNKQSTGVCIVHKESGAMGRASDSRSQLDNKKNAFERLTKTPVFKFWLNKKLYEIRQKETIEETVEKELSAENLKMEIKENGKWIEVPPEYFDTEKAKTEN